MATECWFGRGRRKNYKGREMREFFTSDTHWNHGNILLYCDRPWLQDSDWYESKDTGRRRWVSEEIKKARTEEMNEAMVELWNSVVEPDDTVKHLGDVFFGIGDGRDIRYWESRLNGKIVYIKGNHDRKNQIKGMLTSATMKVSGHELFLTHRPPQRKEEIPDFCDAVICGHVHEKWDYTWADGILVLNVGVDVRKFKPMGLDEVVGEIERLHRKGCVNNGK